MYKASVIIPVYNQKDSLKITLNYFLHQTIAPEEFEVIVVDDGSTDGLQEEMDNMSKFGWPLFEGRLNYFYQENKGRAAARNKGAELAKGKRLIFCDADRFPDLDFIEKHIDIRHQNYVIIGGSLDYFGNIKNLNPCTFEFNKIKKFSRQSLYFKKILSLFNVEGVSNSPIVWASFLVGNSSINSEKFYEVGGFDNNFSTWGFEHFELAYRLYKKGNRFKVLPDCGNYHIPHPREQGYYRTMIDSSANQLAAKYPEQNFEYLAKYLFGEVSLQEFEIKFGGLESTTIDCEEPIIYKLRK